MLARRFNNLLSMIVILTIHIILTSYCFAQSVTIKGKITDSETGVILPGANIVITSNSIETGTAAFSNGEFVLDNLPMGIYTITASYIGYEKKSIAGIVLTRAMT